MASSKVFISLFLCLLWSQLFGQVDNWAFQQKVLKKNKIDSTFKFINKADSTVTYLKYLGKLSTELGETYKIMTSIWILGISQRATNRTLIFDNHNKYVGNYRMTMTEDLPNKIESNQLIFSNLEKRMCESTRVTKISFKNGIPNEIIIWCGSDHGDTYIFLKD